METCTYSSEVLEAVLLPDLGARLHRLRAFGHDVLQTPDDPATHAREPFFWGGYVMAPWCNRLEAGRSRFGSRQLDLASNFPDGSSIHGQVYARPWQERQDGSHAIRAGGDGWPWRYEVAQRLNVSDAELRIDLEVKNLDDEAMPAGVGIHPWFRRPFRAAIHAGRVFPDNLSSEAQPQPVAGPLDLRVLSDVRYGIDATWTDVSDPAVEIVWPERARATIRVEPREAFVVAASPSDVEAIAVEMQTHAPYGLSRLLTGAQGGLALLAPDETLSLVVTLAFEQLG
jgi:aldose 1-epimerase